MHSNTYYYLALAFLSVIILVSIYVRKRNTRYLLLYLSMVSLAYLIEMYIYVFNNSYTYYPKILGNAYYDSNMGAMISNFLIVPAIASFIGSFLLGTLWIFASTLFFWGVEYLFLFLGIYEIHWWSPEYTAFGLFFVFFPSAKFLYRKLLHPLAGFQHTVLLYLCMSSLKGSYQILPVMLFNSRTYEVGWFPDPARDTTAFISLYYLFDTIFCILLTKLPIKPRLIKYMIYLMVDIVINLGLKETHILHSSGWLDMVFYILMPLAFFRLSEAFSKVLASGPPERTIDTPEEQQ